jgi:hypothetical protein
VNNKIISEGLLGKDIFIEGRNLIMFVPWPNTTSANPAELTIWYTEKAML